MSTTLDDLVAQAETLSPQDRFLLIERLESTLVAADPGVEEAWKVEVERRIAAIDRGEESAVPWEQVREDLGLR